MQTARRLAAVARLVHIATTQMKTPSGVPEGVFVLGPAATECPSPPSNHFTVSAAFFTKRPSNVLDRSILASRSGASNSSSMS